jgi:hypothetical protein
MKRIVSGGLALSAAFLFIAHVSLLPGKNVGSARSDNNDMRSSQAAAPPPRGATSSGYTGTSDLHPPSQPRADTSPDKMASACAQAFLETRDNVFQDRVGIAQEWLARDERIVDHLVNLLQALPPQDEVVSHSLNRPASVVKERMAAIDALESFLEAEVTDESREDALAGLEKLANAPVPAGTSEPQKKVLVGERYDAWSALARQVPTRAARMLSGLKPSPRQTLFRQAVLTGLLDRGIKREEVEPALSNLIRVGQEMPEP